MKTLLLLFSLSLTIHAGYFNYSEITPKKNEVLESFRQSSSNGNSLVKKGDFKKYSLCKEDIQSLLHTINSLDLTKDEKKSLQNKMQKYAYIIDTVYTNMKHTTPNLNSKYNKSLNGLLSFNKSIGSTGYSPLLSEWYELAKIKHKYIKHPSYKLSKQFKNKWNSVVLILTDLCLDEDLEEPLLSYLDIYKSYFEDLNMVYKTVDYDRIKSIRPLSYAIKSELEFARPVK